MPNLLFAPRPVPKRRAPIVAGTAIVLLALPVFAVGGFSLGAWGLAAVLWAASQGLGLLLSRLPLGMDNLTSSAVQALGMVFRSIGVMVVLVAIAVSHPHFALAAAIVYALAYSLELGISLVEFFLGAAAE